MAVGGVQGADLEALAKLRTTLENKATALDSLTRQISGAVAAMGRIWDGPDAMSFRQSWNTTHRAKLVTASSELAAAAATVERNRAAQEATSASIGDLSTVLPDGLTPMPAGGTDEPSVKATHTLDNVQSILDDGDDFAVSEGQLDSIQDQLEDLSDEELAHVMAGLTDRQLDVLFHNVHSSGFWSNDWNDRERAEFYDNLARVGETGDIELWYRLGEHSPKINPDPAAGLPDDARTEAERKSDEEYWNGLTYEHRADQSLWGDPHDIDYTDVRQGSIGDCYLIAGMISLAEEDPTIIEDLITPNPNGTYTVHFADGGREVVTPDLIYDAKGDPAFARTESTNAVWPAVLENAYAQKFGGFGDNPGIVGGQSSVAIEAFTGRESSYIKSDDLSLSDMAERFDNGEILGLSTIDKPDDMSTADWVARDDTPDTFKGDNRYQKLHQNHAFIVVEVDETNGTVSVINPWDPSRSPFTMDFDDMQESVNGVRVNAAPQEGAD